MKHKAEIMEELSDASVKALAKRLKAKLSPVVEQPAAEIAGIAKDEELGEDDKLMLQKAYEKYCL